MEIVRMIDTTHTNVDNVPVGIAKVGGYVTGSPNIDWIFSDWGRFPLSGKVRINQGFNVISERDCDEYDAEKGAFSAYQVAHHVRNRVAMGIKWTSVYGTDNTLYQVRQELETLNPDPTWFYGHVTCSLANWNLSETEAVKIIGTEIHGITCKSVQWASPTSNPNMLVPCSNLTLAEANVDLRVADRSWFSDKLCRQTFL